MFDQLILKSLNCEATSKVPIWLMRQAGRYLPEYRKVRKNFKNFLDFCFHPSAAAEVTLQPINRFDFDAAIIFSDILTVPYAFSRNVEFVENKGPILETIKTEAEINALHFDIDRVAKVFEAIELTKREMQKSYREKSLIGFAGSPWTIVCYMVEGQSSKDFNIVRAFAYKHHDIFKTMIDKITEATKLYLREQVRAGADVIKLFDSWAGVLTPDQFRKWVINPTKEIVSSLKSEYPALKIIGFPRKAGLMYREYSIETGVDCTAVDQTVDMKVIRKFIPDKVLQGNLDNLLLAHSGTLLYDRVAEIIEANKGKPFIFNLGHGVLPHTPTENVQELVRIVRSF